VAPVADPPVVKTAAGPKKKVRPETCVAYGDFRSKEACAPQYTSAQRDQLREDAREAYQDALSLDAKCVAAHKGLGRLYADMDDYPRAVASYQKAVKAAPKDAGAWFDMGMCHNHTQEYDRAIEEMGRAVELEPDNRTYGNALAVVFARVGRYDDSLRTFARVNGEATAHYNLGCTLRRLNQGELARQHLEAALQNNPRLEPARTLLAEMSRETYGLPGPPPVQPVGYAEPQPPAEGAAPAVPPPGSP
jgi:tetratricopeptide (TPR) repeat protein